MAELPPLIPTLSGSPDPGPAAPENGPSQLEAATAAAAIDSSTPAATPKKKPKAVAIAVDQVDASGLLGYGIYLLSKAGIVKAPKDDEKGTRPKFSCFNACISPVHVAAGWGVAALNADKKTREFIEKVLGKVLSGNKKGKSGNEDKIHPAINALLDELGLPSFVRLYIEPQFAIPTIASIVKEIDSAYGDSGVAAVKPLCFSCDDSGLATACKINHDVLISTKKSIHKVIDAFGPNRLAQACLISAHHVPFAWKLHDTSAQPVYSYFYGRSSKVKISATGIRCLTDSGSYQFASTDSYDCVALPDQTGNDTCYLIRPKGEEIDKWLCEIDKWLGGKKLPEIDKIINALPDAKKTTVSVPMFRVDTSHRLGQAAGSRKNDYCLWRLFDRQKCKLNRIYYSYNNDANCDLPLWDHYHRTVFEFSNILSAPMSRIEDPQTDIERLGGGSDKAKSTKDAKDLSKFAYIKTEDCTKGIYREEEEMKESANNEKPSEMIGSLSFNTPFLFVVKRKSGNREIPVCLGIFSHQDVENPTPPAKL